MKSKLNIIDCTIRDGGYYNKWDFDNKFVKNYIKTINKINITWIELGFRKLENDSSYGLYLRTEDKIITNLNIPKKIKIAVMIDLSDFRSNDNFKELVNLFNDAAKTRIDLIRIACSFEDINYLGRVINILRKKKYKIAVNLMKFTLLKKNEILNFFERAKKYKPNLFYLADSFGNCSPQLIKKIGMLLKKKFDLRYFGFHGHNNCNLALKNALSAIKIGFHWIDTSVMGMGRGAGNLRLEDYLKHNKLKLEQVHLKKFVKEFMINIYNKYLWGPNKYYKISAKNNIHPTYTQNLLTEKKFSLDVIFKILKYLKNKKTKTYNPDIFDTFFLKIKPIKIINNIDHKEEINLLCNNKIIKNMKLSINNSYKYACLNYSKYIEPKFYSFVFLCNPYRVMTEINKLLNLKKKIIVPNYEIFSNGNKKKLNLIHYNFLNKKKLLIKKKFSSFSKNLVIAYAISFCLSQKIKKIKIYGLSKSSENIKIIKNFKNYIIKNKINSRIYF